MDMKILGLVDGDTSSAYIVMRDIARYSRNNIDVQSWVPNLDMSGYDLVYIHSGILLSEFNPSVVEAVMNLEVPVMAGLRGMLNWKRWVNTDGLTYRPFVDKISAILCSNRSFLNVSKRISSTPAYLAPSCIDPTLFVPTPAPLNFTVGFVGHRDHGSKGYAKFKTLPWVQSVADGSIPHSEMPQFYNGVSVYCCTSNEEGAPVPPKEAASCGRPVCSFSVGDIQDWLPKKLIASDITDMSRIIRELQYRDAWRAAALACFEAVEPYYAQVVAKTYDTIFES